MRNRIVLILALGLVLGLVLPFTSSAQVRGLLPQAFTVTSGPRIIPPSDVYYGKTYAGWSEAWWQWAFSIPVDNHPLFDKGDCSVGQSGPVWFLGGKFCANDDPTCGANLAYRTCNVPTGKALFFPVANTEDSLIEDPSVHSIADIRGLIDWVMDDVDGLIVEVDKAAVPFIKSRYRVEGNAFQFTLPADNLLNAIGVGPIAAGTYGPSVESGYYILLSPLPPGQHTLHIHAAFPDFGGFEFDIYYTLNVGATVLAPTMQSTRKMVLPRR